MSKTLHILLALLIVTMVAGPAQAQDQSQEPDGATVTFIHGIRGFFADVYLDDELILPGFAPERTTEPMPLAAGVHRIDLREADAPPTAKPAVTKEFTVPDSGRLTAVAHWVGVEECTITLFNESEQQIGAGESRLIARHAAATEEVQLKLDEQGASTRLSPQQEFAETVDPGVHTVSVTDAASDASLVGSARIPAEEGVARVIYLVGSAKEDTLAVLAQTIDGLESDPTGVPTGNSGLAATADTDGPPRAALAGALAGAFAVGVLLRRRRQAMVARR